MGRGFRNNLQPIFTEDKNPAQVLPALVQPLNQLLQQIRQETRRP